MFCSNCGKEIDNQNNFCPYCGKKTHLPEQAPVQPTESDAVQYQPADQYVSPYVTQNPPKKSKKGLILAIVIPCAAVLTIIIALLVSLIIGSSQKEALHKKLMRDWSRVEFDDVTYTLILDFSDDEIEYIFDSTYVDRTVATYEYEVISGDTILVEDFGKVKVSFNDEETMMTLTPSITDRESSQYWYNFD